jgi:ankyrin repeat protein
VKRAPKEQKELLIQTVDATKKSALHIAAKEGYEVLVEYLLAEGFGINARDRELKTALHYSCIQNQEVVSGILIEKKCDTFARDNK